MLVKRLFFDEYPFTGMPSGGFDKPVKRKAAPIVKLLSKKLRKR
jgi:hypothetical protein